MRETEIDNSNRTEIDEKRAKIVEEKRKERIQKLKEMPKENVMQKMTGTYCD